ncbi:MAG TPA: ComEC/Rec2 family competence protein, partial [Pyrinomonadaceae bacterium]|nr:ComEC/Rec2 family competence protein [Pyrinomonadaceae bacterium]
AAFAAGILLAHFSSLNFLLSLSAAALCALLALVAFKRRRFNLATSFLVLAYACAGASFAQVEGRGVGAERVRRLYEEGRVASGDPVEITGVVARAPVFAPDGFYLALGVERLSARGAERAASGAVELFAPVRDAQTRERYAELELRRGARVRVLVALERAEEFRNPGGASLTEFLERRGVDARGTLKSPLLVERLDDERVPLLLVWLEAWREHLRGRMSELFAAETAGVLQAALLGNRHGLTRASAERFREGGTFHVLVISGLHISFVGGLVLLLMRRVTRRRALQFAVPCVVVWLYTLAVGAESSVVRAALMFTVVAFAPVVHRRASTVNALGGAALVLLVWRPSELFTASFQLTFLSVLVIVALAWPMLSKLKEVGEWRPTQATPYPPLCPRAWKTLGETLFWSERNWQKEMARSSYQCRLFKTPRAARLEKLFLQRPLRYVFAAVLISACVQIGLLPLLVVYFHRLSIAAVLLNVFVGVLMALLSISALLTLVLAQMSGGVPAPALLWLTEKTNWLMTHSVDPFSDLRVAQLRLPEYAGWPGVIYVLYFIPLALIVLWLVRWRPVASPSEAANDDDLEPVGRFKIESAIFAFVVLLMIVVAHPFSAGWPDGKLRVDFLDVGQGDATLVTMPDGVTLLIDGGGRPQFDNRPRERDEEEQEEGVEPFERDARNIGEAVVSEYLWWRGLHRVDYVLATHADADHIDGLNDVVKNFEVRAAFVGRASEADAGYRRLSETLARNRVPVNVINQGDTLRFDQVTVEVLWPPPAGDGATNFPSGNDDSLVLRLRFGEKTILFTGDIEAFAESALTASGYDLGSDAVKVAHHGSKTSSTSGFVSATHPRWAIISVGTDSPYGHPDANVVERWRANKANVLTTGKSGTVTFVADGGELKVNTYIRD